RSGSAGSAGVSMIFLQAPRGAPRGPTPNPEEKTFKTRERVTQPRAVAGGGEGPEVQPPSVFGTENELRNEAVLEHVGGAPLARYHRVVPEMPPGVIAELLRPTIDLPSAKRFEAFVVHYENPAGGPPLGISERRHID